MAAGVYFSTTRGTALEFGKHNFKQLVYSDMTTMEPVEGELHETSVGTNPMFTFSVNSGDYFKCFNTATKSAGPSLRSVFNLVNNYFENNKKFTPNGFKHLDRALHAFLH